MTAQVQHVQRAVRIIESLPPEKLYVALYLLEHLTGQVFQGDNDVDLAIRLAAFEMSCETETVTPEEALEIEKGFAEIEAGQGVKAEDVWKELGL